MVPVVRHVHILEMNGDSYRLKQSKRRQRSSREAASQGASTHDGRDPRGAPGCHHP